MTTASAAHPRSDGSLTPSAQSEPLWPKEEHSRMLHFRAQQSLHPPCTTSNVEQREVGDSQSRGDSGWGCRGRCDRSSKSMASGASAEERCDNGAARNRVMPPPVVPARSHSKPATRRGIRSAAVEVVRRQRRVANGDDGNTANSWAGHTRQTQTHRHEPIDEDTALPVDSPPARCAPAPLALPPVVRCCLVARC